MGVTRESKACPRCGAGWRGHSGPTRLIAVVRNDRHIGYRCPKCNNEFVADDPGDQPGQFRTMDVEVQR